MQRRRPTILDVAHRAGVSVGTVSNVLNSPESVAEARRNRVLRAIDVLGYSQNPLARGLRTRRSTMVGLCVPHTSNAYFSALVNAFEEMASDRGFELLQVLSGQDSKTEQERVAALLKYNIGGLILVPNIHPERTLKLISQSGTPLVVVDRPILSKQFDHVSFDNRGAMFDATRRLIALGHRRILFVVRSKDLLVTQHRIGGLLKAARTTPGRTAAEVFECPYDEVSLTAFLSQAFAKPRPPSAIIVSNRGFAAWTLRALRVLKVGYPRDVSLLSFDEPDWADLVTPPLSVVRQPTGAIARKAWEFLIRRMADEAVAVQREQMTAEIIFRELIEPAANQQRQIRRRPSTGRRDADQG